MTGAGLPNADNTGQRGGGPENAAKQESTAGPENNVSRRLFGGRLTLGPGSPWVTYTVLVACAAMYLLCLVFPGLTMKFYFMPALGMAEPWRFLTAAFLHSVPSPMHLICNMWALLVVGPPLEKLLGHARFLYLYLLSAFAGSAASLLTCQVAAWLGSSQTLSYWVSASVGASGAVFGLFGAFLAVSRRLQAPIASLLVLIGVNLVIGFVVPGIAWQAHLGGLLAGLCLGAIFGRELVWRARALEKAATQITDSLSQESNLDGNGGVQPQQELIDVIDSSTAVVSVDNQGNISVQAPSFGLRYLVGAVALGVVLIGVVLAMYLYYEGFVATLRQVLIPYLVFSGLTV